MKAILSAILVVLLTPTVFANDIRIHAPHTQSFSCIEHWDGQFEWVGDALGTDCVIQGWYEDERRLFVRPYINQGFQNEDWYGFNKNVLAPCDCKVSKIHVNDVVNQPGIMTPGRASSITFVTADNVSILIAHVRDIAVAKGDSVKAGQVVAKVGNNGYSRNPHVHIAAWDSNQTPLQIQFDQKTISLDDRKNSLE